MSRRMFNNGRAVLALGVFAIFLSACGGGGGGGEPDLWVENFSVPDFSGILLDEGVSWKFSTGIKAASLNQDSVRMRTGTDGGEAPRGTFVKGIFLIDPTTGTRVVVDPEQISPENLARAQLDGNLSLIPDGARYDLGADSPLNGARRVLFNNSLSDRVTFVPDIPTRPDLSDTGYVPAATYSVVLPAWPSTNTVLSEGDDPLLARNGRVFVSTFTTVPITAPTIFLGGENEGRPRVVNTDPTNGATSVVVEKRISIRFQQPLDPRTITTDNFFLTVSSVPGSPQEGISIFLRQTRLGLVEVVLTPLQNLSPDATYQVTISSGVRDLLGSAMEPFVFSFSTGASTGEPVDILESFNNNSKEDSGLTTANWNGSKMEFVGATPGELTAVFAPFAGTGIDGAFTPIVGDITFLTTDDIDETTGEKSLHIFNYTSINIPIGARVVGEGDNALVMRCQGDVLIRDEIDVSGQAGGVGQTGPLPDDSATGGSPGPAGPGGFNGGAGAFFDISSSGNYNGLSGAGPTSGGGVGGGTGNQEDWTDLTNPAPASAMREGGGGGAHITDGTDAGLAGVKSPPGDGGFGGTAYGSGDFSSAPLVPPTVGVPTLTEGTGGAGGGGGGGEDDAPLRDLDANPPVSGIGPEDEGGGGGGGGGGSLQISAYGDISVFGTILANGGNGGDSFRAATGGLGQGAPGGGGGGGSVWLQANGQISLDSLAKIEALGGTGGQGDGDGGEVRAGGDGGEGIIRLEDTDGSILVPSSVQPTSTDTVGTFAPTLTLASTALSLFYNQFITTPNYGAAIIDQDPFDGTIEIFVQGAREDVLLVGPQPVDPDDPIEMEERLNSTDWLPISEIDLADNFQYLRFRVEFLVDPVHDFADPLSVVRELRIPVSTTPD